VVVLLTMARPYVITEWNGLANALVVNYRGGEEVGPALASLLFGDYTPRGKLPWQLPRTLDQVLRAGGTDTQPTRTRAGISPTTWGRPRPSAPTIRNRINAGQTVPSTYGNPLYPYGAGLQGWS
jgi:hypothetical protein